MSARDHRRLGEGTTRPARPKIRLVLVDFRQPASATDSLGWVGRRLTPDSAKELQAGVKAVAGALRATLRPEGKGDGLVYLSSRAVLLATGGRPAEGNIQRSNYNTLVVARPGDIIKALQTDVERQAMPFAEEDIELERSALRHGSDGLLELTLTDPLADDYYPGRPVDEQRRLCGAYDPEYDQDAARRDSLRVVLGLGTMLLTGGRPANFDVRFAALTTEHLPEVVNFSPIRHNRPGAA